MLAIFVKYQLHPNLIILITREGFGYEGGSSADVVAKVVLKAATSENPSPMYLAGMDIETWMEAKRSMSDGEFHKMMKELMK